ncbi:hypothetical protein Taro_016000 [Colocasia esculenta]|uniref:Uncharacterized protein n=1 Tax=Colocasia esculenta TaxID=4460 RepID=A0A843UNX1_COLES|nr:hypothetical protein [Colocasia esculenta]
MWRSSWWLRSCGTTTRSSSSSPSRSAATCTNRPLEVDQRSTLCQRKEVWSAIQGTVLALSEPGTDPMNATA